MRARPATLNDCPKLEAFGCASSSADFHLEVEEWFHDDAAGWMRDADIDPRVVLFEDADTGELQVVVAHELLDNDDPGFGRFVRAVAVATIHQGQGLGGQALYAVYVSAATVLSPNGTMVWKVHDQNYASKRMCWKLGWDTFWSMPEGEPYRHYAVPLGPPP